jgi:hypothetical protein
MVGDVDRSYRGVMLTLTNLEDHVKKSTLLLGTLATAGLFASLVAVAATPNPAVVDVSECALDVEAELEADVEYCAVFPFSQWKPYGSCAAACAAETDCPDWTIGTWLICLCHT